MENKGANKGAKIRGSMTTLKSLAISLDQNSWSEEQWLELRCIFTVVPTGFADILIVILKQGKSRQFQSFVLKQVYKWSCHQVKGENFRWRRKVGFREERQEFGFGYWWQWICSIWIQISNLVWKRVWKLLAHRWYLKTKFDESTRGNCLHKEWKRIKSWNLE